MFDDPISGAGASPRTDSTEVALHPPRIGRFSLLRPVGRGGMGVVYEAIQDEPRRRVALKLMHGTASDEQAIARFKREADLLGRLQHPNIAEVYDAGTHVEGRLKIPYYALAFVDSAKSIAEYAAEKKLPRQERLKLFISICRAVQYAHSRGVVHRDLKPSNLLVGSDGVVRVIDMGISKPLEELAENLTTGDETLGTLRYMPLETLTRGEGAGGLPAAPINYVLADMYALGVILYQLMMDASPYDGDVDGRKMTVDARLRAKVRRPRSIDGQFSADLEAVLMKALHAEPAQRYQSAEDLAADLESWMDGRPVRARGDSLIYRARKRVRRTLNHHPIVVAILLSALCFEGADRMLWVVSGTGWHRTWARWMMIWPRHAPDAPMETVVLVAIDDDAARVGREVGIAPFDPSSRPGFRSLHGAVIDRLSEAGAKVVLVDVAFRRPTPFDSGLIAGARAAEARGTAMVWATPEWNGSQPPVLIEPLQSIGTRGSPFLDVGDDRPLGISVARVGIAGETEPGVAAMAIAAFKGVQRDALFEFRSDGYLNASSDGRDPKRIAPVSDATLPPDEEIKGVVRRGDQLLNQWVEAPSRQAIKDSTLSIRQVLVQPVEELAQRVRGKVVVYGDAREGGDPEFAVPNGHKLRGFEIIGSGVNAVLSGTEVGRSTRRFEYGGVGLSVDAVLWLLAAVLGVCAAHSARRWAALVSALSITNAGMVVIWIVIFRWYGTIIDPLLPACVLSINGALIWLAKPR
jgi:CHASE2 domain-containing sensor protein